MLQALLFRVGVFLLVETVALWWSPTVALAGGALYALDPYSKHYVALLLSEVLAGTLLLACAYAFTRAWRAGSAPRWWLAAGAAAGALTLTRVVFVLVPVLLVAALVAPGRRLAARGRCDCRRRCCSSRGLRGRGRLRTTSVGVLRRGLQPAARCARRVSKTQTDVLADSAFVRDVEASHGRRPARQLLADPRAHPRYVVRAGPDDARACARQWRAVVERAVAGRVGGRLPRLLPLERARGLVPARRRRAPRAPHDRLVVPRRSGRGRRDRPLRGPAPARAVVVFVLVYTLAMATHHVEARFAMPSVASTLRSSRLLRPQSSRAQSQNAAVAGSPPQARTTE